MIGTKSYPWGFLQGLSCRWRGRIYGNLQLHIGAFALPVNRDDFDGHSGTPHQDRHAKQAMLVELLGTIIHRKRQHTGRRCHFANNGTLLSHDSRGDLQHGEPTAPSYDRWVDDFNRWPSQRYLLRLLCELAQALAVPCSFLLQLDFFLLQPGHFLLLASQLSFALLKLPFQALH